MTVGRIPNIEGGIQPTLLTTTGDIMYASSANNPARLGIGTSAQVLTVASGVPSWATPSSGGMTLLSTTTMSGTSVTLSSISGSYKTLYGLAYGYTNSGSNDMFIFRPNDVQSARFSTFSGTGGNAVLVTNNSDISLCFNTNGFQVLGSNANNAVFFEIKNYASTASFKPIITGGNYIGKDTDPVGFGGSGSWTSTSAITSLTFYNTGGGSFTAGTILLYGVN